MLLSGVLLPRCRCVRCGCAPAAQADASERLQAELQQQLNDARGQLTAAQAQAGELQQQLQQVKEKEQQVSWGAARQAVLPA